MVKDIFYSVKNILEMEVEMDFDKLRESYKEEASEILAELEGALLDLEKDPSDADVVAAVFRMLHTIKGSGSMYGYDAIAGFTHKIENIYDLVRNGKLGATKELITLTLEAKDQIHALLQQPHDAPPENAEELKALEESFEKFIEGASFSSEIETLESHGDKSSQPEEAGPDRDSGTLDISSKAPLQIQYKISFRTTFPVKKNSLNPLAAVEELANIGSCKVKMEFESNDDQDSPRVLDRWMNWEVDLIAAGDENAVKSVFMFADDECKVKIVKISQKAAPAARSVDPAGVASGATPANESSGAALDFESKKKAKKEVAVKAASSIRVSADKLDRMMDLVGELVTVQARINDLAVAEFDEEDEDAEETPLMVVAEQLERLTASLRDQTLSVRMVPIGATFSKFSRLVRDLSAELGKEINLVTEGAETELDKTVIDQLESPLVHLIRNSIDHGIEAPDVREAANKSRGGTLKLTASQSGGHVFIKISDDGAGLDLDRIRSAAVEKGLIPAEIQLADKDLLMMIFSPGFSTAKKVTSVSGRGVGMDVVKKSIGALRGTVEVTTKKGEGSTFVIRLPLTLAIIDGLMVAVDGTRFVMPLSMVEECVDLTHEEVASAHGKQLAKIRGELVPYIRLRERFLAKSELPAIEQIVVTNVDGDRIGLVVDAVVGQHQTVIKALGNLYEDLPDFSGATILGDGSVSLIVDVPALTHRAIADAELSKMRRH